jgi:hypothetical protein
MAASTTNRAALPGIWRLNSTIRLHGDRRQADHCADANPVPAGVVLTRAESTGDRPYENDQRRHNRDREQEAAFRRQLEVVVVRFVHVLVADERLVLEHRRAKRIQPGAREREIGDDARGVVPDTASQCDGLARRAETLLDIDAGPEHDHREKGGERAPRCDGHHCRTGSPGRHDCDDEHRDEKRRQA